MNTIHLRTENKFRTPIHGRNFQGTTTCVGALYPEDNVQVYWTWKWFDFQIRGGFSEKSETSVCEGFQTEGNGVVHRRRNEQHPDFSADGSCRSRYCGFQFQNMGHLIGMWDTREIITGLPYDFSHLITTHFAEFYRQNFTDFVLTASEREQLGISDEEYIRENKAVWGEKWENQ